MVNLNDENLIKLRFNNGKLILPYFRYELLCFLDQKAPTLSGEKRHKKIKLAQRFWRILRNLKLPLSKKIVLFTSTLFEIKDSESGSYYNCLDGYYYNLYPNDTLIIEDCDSQYNWRTIGSYANFSTIRSLIDLISSTLASILNRVHKQRNDDYDYLIKKYPGFFSQDLLSCTDYRVNIYSFLIRFLLKMIRPSLIGINCGTYGQTYGILINEARKLNIKTFEMQHGIITDTHLAYHTENYIRDSKEFREYLPDYLLTFGEYWHKSINLFNELIAVGNPHLSKFLSNNNADIKQDFLIISQDTVRNELIAFTKELATYKKESKILYRLHPKELIDDYAKEFQPFNNIVLTTSTVNLYIDILQSKVVIGAYSTVLYEALAFNKPVYILDLPLSRRYLSETIFGKWIKNAYEIDSFLNENLMVDNEMIWKSNFDNNIKSFYSTVLS
jgi:hypothetical protein